MNTQLTEINNALNTNLSSLVWNKDVLFKTVATKLLTYDIDAIKIYFGSEFIGIVSNPLSGFYFNTSSNFVIETKESEKDKFIFEVTKYILSLVQK